MILGHFHSSGSSCNLVTIIDGQSLRTLLYLLSSSSSTLSLTCFPPSSIDVEPSILIIPHTRLTIFPHLFIPPLHRAPPHSFPIAVLLIVSSCFHLFSRYRYVCPWPSGFHITVANYFDLESIHSFSLSTISISYHPRYFYFPPFFFFFPLHAFRGCLILGLRSTHDWNSLPSNSTFFPHLWHLYNSYHVPSSKRNIVRFDILALVCSHAFTRGVGAPPYSTIAATMATQCTRPFGRD